VPTGTIGAPNRATDDLRGAGQWASAATTNVRIDRYVEAEITRLGRVRARRVELVVTRAAHRWVGWLVLGAVALPGCGGANALSVSTPVVPLLDARGCATGAYEGVYTEQNQMKQYFACTIPRLDEFISWTGQGVKPPTYFYVTYGDVVVQGCVNSQGSDEAGDESYFYCPADGTVYVGAAAMWSEYNDKMGDMALPVSVAHEIGHHFQAAAGVTSHTNSESIDMENQADCVAGAWAAHAKEQGWLEWDDDLADLQALIGSMADVERRDRDHGLFSERASSFNLGFRKGIFACNSIYEPIFVEPSP
jgi:hypothetical protein